MKLQQTNMSGKSAEIHKRIKFIVNRMESAIANDEFEKARFYSDEERNEREKLRRLQKQQGMDQAVMATVSKDDIEEVVARWTCR